MINGNNANDHFERVMVQALMTESEAVRCALLERMLQDLVGPEVFSMRKEQYEWQSPMRKVLNGFYKGAIVSGVSIGLGIFFKPFTALVGIMTALAVWQLLTHRAARKTAQEAEIR